MPPHNDQPKDAKRLVSLVVFASLEDATDTIIERLTKLQETVDRSIASKSFGQNQEGPPTQVNHRHFGSSHSDHRQSSLPSVIESSKDFLHIPACRTTADAILRWPIFEATYPDSAFASSLFAPLDDDWHAAAEETFTIDGGVRPVDDERVPLLVDNFLENVHTKNPILDVEELVKSARRVPTYGLGWDASSCAILLACALGSLARPFDQAVPTTPGSAANVKTFGAEGDTVRQAESYFVLAGRRLGVLKHSLLGSQCYFLAGVYLMYTLRPLLSWQYFSQASTMYQLHIRSTYQLEDISQLAALQTPQSNTPRSKGQRLEQSMYWSLFKTECEFRVELSLPLSDIAANHHPQLFPSPPSPVGDVDADGWPSPTSLVENQEFDLRQHAKRLCNEEESWYYYLTEIALRRIGNRIINTFFRKEPSAWLNIEPLLDIALEFDTQVSAWSANLPPAMQDWETSYTIRAPNSIPPSSERSSHVSRELSWATDNRLLEMRSWLYQPFLFYLIHGGNLELRGDQESGVLKQLISSGVECNLKILDVRSLRHRHHGLWYDLRSIVAAALILLAIVRSGHEQWIPGGTESLVGTGFSAVDEPVEGSIGNALEQLDHWSGECPSLSKHKLILEEVTRATFKTLPTR